MKIIVTDIGKRFNREWIFRHLNFEFINGRSYAIVGPNGSGKSTLLQVVAGAMLGSEGRVEFVIPRLESSIPGNQSASDDHPETENFYRHISIATPYLEVIEEMTLTEFLLFHQIFKPFIREMDILKIISAVGLERSAQKQIRYFSSGMKQRVKLAQAFFSDSPVLLLDEPCTNLDIDGITLYNQLILNYSKDRITIVSSNDLQEYSFCDQQLNIMDYKK
jgi:ABC-2 type transport system ATP-binding protein